MDAVDLVDLAYGDRILPSKFVPNLLGRMLRATKQGLGLSLSADRGGSRDFRFVPCPCGGRLERCSVRKRPSFGNRNEFKPFPPRACRSLFHRPGWHL